MIMSIVWKETHACSICVWRILNLANHQYTTYMLYLRASQVVKVVPVNMSPTMIKGMYQLMGQHIIHTALGVDHVLTQHNLQQPQQVIQDQQLLLWCCAD